MPRSLPPYHRTRILARVVAFAGLTLTAHAQWPAWAASAPRVHALTGARVVVRPGLVLESATIVLRDGAIEAVGTGVPVPPDARTWDVSGTTIYPGLIEAHWARPMPAPDKPGPPLAHPNSKVRPERDAADLPIDSDAIRTMRKTGFTIAAVAPTGGIYPGSGSIIGLGDSSPGENALARRWAQHIAIAPGRSEEGYPASMMGATALARQTLLDAVWARDAAEAYRRNPRQDRPAVDRWSEALLPALRGDWPVVFSTETPLDSLRASRLAGEFQLKAVLLGNGQEYRRLAEISALELPIILPVSFPERPKLADPDDLTVPTDTLLHWDLAPSNPARLAGAGVRFALSTHGLDAASTLFERLARAKDRGLTADQLLAALTTEPAAILGLSHRAGTLEVGKIANLLVVEGDLWVAKPTLRSVWIDGRPYPVADTAATKKVADKTPAVPDPVDPAKTSETDQPVAWEPERWPASPTDVVVRNAVVWTSGPQGILEGADLLVRGGKIAAIGRNLAAPPGARVIDASGKHVTAGLIDAHSHTAVQGSVNEGTNNISAEVRVEDVLDPTDVNIYRQLAGGLTVANVLHGSSNAIGGQNAVIKLRWGAAPDGLRFSQAPSGIKFALGENPKRANWGDQSRYPQTRLGVEQLIRERFLAARDYQRAWKDWQKSKTGTQVRPKRDLQLEAIAEILDGRRLVHSHAYRADEMLMLLDLAEHFGFRVATLQHALEAYKIADEVAAAGAGVSLFSDWWGYKYEVVDAIPWAGTITWRRGVLTSFNSDSDELARRMNLEAAKAVRYGGVPEEQALAFVTINPARQLGIDRWVGSLEPGKDADFVIWSGHPLSSLSICEQTWIDGRPAFDRSIDLEKRAATDLLRAQLVAKALAKPPSAKNEDDKPSEPSLAAPTATPTPLGGAR